MTCCSFVTLAAPISLLSSLNYPVVFTKCQVFHPHNVGRRQFCRKFNFQACALGSQVVPAPAKPVRKNEDHDPFNVDDPVYKDFMTACSEAFKSNGWVHVPCYLGTDETRGLLLEAKRHLENVRLMGLIAFTFDAVCVINSCARGIDKTREVHSACTRRVTSTQ
jgi:hypothetical protein